MMIGIGLIILFSLSSPGGTDYPFIPGTDSTSLLVLNPLG